MTPTPLLLGLTGGIGSGKSTVAQLLARHGGAVIDADAISRASTATGGSAIDPIRAAFGPALIGADGAEIGRHEGEAEWDSAAVRAEIARALAAAAD